VGRFNDFDWHWLLFRSIQGEYATKKLKIELGASVMVSSISASAAKDGVRNSPAANANLILFSTVNLRPLRSPRQLK
jgi:hypothetical protein